MRLSPGLLAAVAALCIAAGAGQAQYVEDSIDVGGPYVGSLAYNCREDVLYGRSAQAGLFFAISCDSNKVVVSFPVSNPCQVAYDSTDNKAYCTQFDDSLLVVDGATHTRLRSMPMYGATYVVWDQVSNHVYVSCQNTNEVAVVDCTNDSLLKYISVGACPLKMYLNTLGRRLYVQNYDVGTVSIVDLTNDRVTKTLNVGGNPNAGYYCPGADKFYSAGNIRECVVIGGQSDTVVARVPLSGNAEVVSATGNENGTLVYLGTSDGGIDDSVATVSTANDSVQATAKVDGGPEALACYRGSGLVYCATARRGWVYVLSSDGAQVRDSFQVAWSPFVFVQVTRHNRLYLGHLGSRYIYVLRDTSAGIAEPQSPRTGFSGASVTPNPFTRSLVVSLNSSINSGGVARVYAQDGRLVRQTLIPAGEARWVWDGRDDSGAPLPPGVYMLEAGSGVRAKVVKLK